MHTPLRASHAHAPGALVPARPLAYTRAGQSHTPVCSCLRPECMRHMPAPAVACTGLACAHCLHSELACAQLQPVAAHSHLPSTRTRADVVSRTLASGLSA
eukprot:4082690-Alexandrium_andersonii.AAC.1